MAEPRYLRLTAAWIFVVAAVVVAGYFYIDRKSDDEARLSAEVERLRRENAELRAAAVEEAAAGESGVTTVRDIEKAFQAAARRQPVVELPELPERETEFDSLSPKAVTIEDRVRHAWRFGKLDEVERLLPVYLAAVGVRRPRNFISRKNNEISLEVRLSRRQLVELVRIFDAAGFRFKSWQPPYPAHEHFSGPASREVRYIAVFE